MAILIPDGLETYNKLVQKKASRTEIVYALQQLSDQWLTQKREKKAIECLDQAMLTLEASPSPEEDVLLAGRYHQVGHLWRQLGNHKLTGMYYKKALERYQEIHTPTPHYDVAVAHFVLASFLDQIWKQKPAQFHYEQALQMMTKSGKKYHKEIAVIQEKLETIKQKKPRTTM